MRLRWAKSVRDVRAMLQEHEEVDQGQTLIVNFNGYGKSSIGFFRLHSPRQPIG